MDRLHQSGIILAFAWLVLLFLVLPAFVVIPVSFTDTRYLSLPQGSWSLQHWHHLFTDPRWLASMATSFGIAVAATGLALFVGTLCAVGCWRIASRWTDKIKLAMLVPLVVPTIVYALGIYRVLVTLRLLGTPLGVILTHAVTGLPFVLLTVSASLSNFDPRIEQAARNLGASATQTLRLVIVPNILPGILSGAIFAFVHSWDELIIVIFIAGRLFTLPRMMWDGINDNLDPTIAVVATSLILFTMLALLAEMGLRAKRDRLAMRQGP
jgi:putative spermidine/putrescine transport system permease protein